jgi:16S rRNA (adenine(1408)-N(1))-methyltransferase
MQVVNGKNVVAVDPATVAAWAARYEEVIVDLGTGDGRFVGHLARRGPARAVIGVDTCRDNLGKSSRTAPENALFVVADALALPCGLQGVATGLTINFPWGSLLRGLLDGHAGLLDGLCAVGCPGLALTIRLNAVALGDAGWTIEAGAERLSMVLRGAGLAVGSMRMMGVDELRGCPTTWAKRLAFGRDPRAICVEATLVGEGRTTERRGYGIRTPTMALIGVGISRIRGSQGCGNALPMPEAKE